MWEKVSWLGCSLDGCILFVATSIFVALFLFFVTFIIAFVEKHFYGINQ